MNFNSKEVHKVSDVSGKCHVEMMTNAKYAFSQKRYLKKGFNGCRYCNKKEDMG